MPSAKRNRAKARKAKTKEQQEDPEELPNRNHHEAILSMILSGMNLSEASTSLCDHGSPTPADSICQSFLKTYQSFYPPGTAQQSESLIEAVNAIIKDQPQVWHSRSTRETVHTFLCAAGVNLALESGAGQVMNSSSWQKDLEKSFSVSFLIFVLENYDVSKGDLAEALYGIRSNNSAIRSFAKICGGGSRELVRFYKKRVPCQCLTDIYSDLKTTRPKTSICDGCNKVKERSNFQVCGVCRGPVYCSRECQASHWQNGHKEMCGKIAAVKAAANSDQKK